MVPANRENQQDQPWQGVLKTDGSAAHAAGEPRGSCWVVHLFATSVPIARLRSEQTKHHRADPPWRNARRVLIESLARHLGSEGEGKGEPLRRGG